MYLSTIKLQGFKIFEQLTTVNLDPKYTIITGLNGSGKSNIIDGILFVLGIESLKLLRVNNLKQLININCKSCTVSLQFNNIDTAKLKDTKFAALETITIKRILDLNLKQKVFLNESTISFSDLKSFLNLFNLFTGNKPSFIIQQGQVGQLLTDANIISGSETLLDKEVKSIIEKENIEIKKRKISIVKELDDLTRDVISEDIDNLVDYDFEPMDLTFLDNSLNSKNRFISYLLEISGTKEFQNDKNSFITKLRKTESKLLTVNNTLKTQIVPHLKELSIYKKYERNLKDYNEFNETVKNIEIFQKTCQLLNLIEDHNKLNITFSKNDLKNIEEIENKKFVLENDLKNLTTEIFQLESKNLKLKKNVDKKNIKDTENYKNEIETLKNILLNEDFFDYENEILSFYRENNICVSKTNYKNITETTLLNSLKIDKDFIKKYDFDLTKILKEDTIMLLNTLDNQLNLLQKHCPYPLMDNVYGSVLENIEFSPKYEKAFNAVIGSRFNNLIVDNEDTAKCILKEKDYTCIPISRIKFKPKVENSLIDYCKYDLKVEKAIQFLLNDIVLLDCNYNNKFEHNNNHDQNNRDDSNNSEFRSNKENRVKNISVTLDGTIYNPKGSLTGGSVFIYKRKDFIKTYKKITELKNKLENILDGLSKDTLEDLITFLDTEGKTYINSIDNSNGLKNSNIYNNKHSLNNNIINNDDKNRKKIDKIMANILLVKSTKKILLTVNKLTTIKRNSSKNKQELEQQLSFLNKKLLETEAENERIEIQNQVAAMNMDSYRNNMAQLEILAAMHIKIETELNELKKVELKDTKDVLLNENEIKAIEQHIEKVLCALSKYNDGNKKGLPKINLSLIEKYLASFLSITYTSTKTVITGKYDYLNKDLNLLNINPYHYDSLTTLNNYLTPKITDLSSKINVTFNKSNIEQLTLNKQKILELSYKMKKLKKDSLRIFTSITKLEKTSLNELSKTRAFINSNVNQQINEFLPHLKIYITNNNSLLISTDGKTYKSDFNQLSGGQKSIISLSLVFTGMKYNKSPLYVLDEVDAALDMSHTQFLGSVYNKTDVQFLVVSLKNENCNKLVRVVRKGGKSFVVS
ncbi:Structural maintenance of chromosomes protein 2 [Cucumispora dikerogammari]|nr:Structural maintenance of chromosomes protein 2 [Cucumispora dikerogammari]